MRPISSFAKLRPFIGPFFTYHLKRKTTPILAGYKLTHKCNLRCTHCPYWKRSGPEQDFAGVQQTLRRLRDMGVRILILEGGEPLLWRDGRHTIEDVTHAARELFPCVCITTNGLLPWGHLPLDRTWVSLDGPAPVHDTIRGEGVFQQVMANIEKEGRGKAFVSTTISSHNAEYIPELLSILRGRVEGVTIQFYYPYGGLPDTLFLTPKERGPILKELVRLKRAGYPVANSILSLNQMKQAEWKCEDTLLANAEPDGVTLHGCYLKNRAESNCAHCGFTAHNEMTLAFQGRLQSIITGLKIFSIIQ